MSSCGQAWWDFTEAAGVGEVRLGGEFDVATTPSLRRELGDREPGVPLVFDVGAVTFADLTLVPLLLDLDQAGAAVGAPVTVRVPEGSAVRRLLQVTGADQQLVVMEGREALSRPLAGR